MKQNIKTNQFAQLVLGCVLLVLAVFGESKSNAASTYTTNITTGIASTNYLFVGPAAISSITLQSLAGAVTATFYDYNAAQAWYTNNNYTNIVQYTTNLVNNYVTTTGVTNFTTNAVLYTYQFVTVANTNSLPALTSHAVAANSAQTFSENIIAEKGLVMTVSTNCTVSVVYRNPLQN